MDKKYGLDALKKELNALENKKGKNVKVFLENNQSMVVRVPNIETCVSFYKAHSDYEAEIRPHACHLEKEDGEADVYDVLSERFLKEASACYKTDPDTSKELWLKGKRLEPKIRMLFGFYDLGTGEPVILELAKKYGESLIKTMEEFGEDITNYAFKITRSGEESSTNYTMLPIMNMKTLKEEQKENFDKLASVPFDTTLFESCMYFKERNDQIEDLIKMGYDVSEFTGEKTPLQVMKENEAEEEKTPKKKAASKDTAKVDLKTLSAEELDEIYGQVTSAGFDDKEYQQQVLAEVERRIEENSQEAV